MMKRKRGASSFKCASPRGHEFTETLYATRTGALRLRRTCRICLLTVLTRFRYIRDPREPETTS